MALTEAQKRELINLFFTQQTDYILAIIDRVFGVKYGTVTLESGINTIVFTNGAGGNNPYEDGTEYRFVELSCHAVEGGYDIGKPTITNKNENGFQVEVDEPATFSYITQSYKFWISDENGSGAITDTSGSLNKAGIQEVISGENTITFKRTVDGEEVNYPFPDANYVPNGYGMIGLTDRVDGIIFKGQTKDGFLIDSPVACTFYWTAIKF